MGISATAADTDAAAIESMGSTSAVTVASARSTTCEQSVWGATTTESVAAAAATEFRPASHLACTDEWPIRASVSSAYPVPEPSSAAVVPPTAGFRSDACEPVAATAATMAIQPGTSAGPDASASHAA